MTLSVKRLWKWLDEWNATIFLVAGGLSLLGTILAVAGALLSMSMQGPASVIVFTGTVLSFVALLGFYPRLADRAPRLAQVGILFIMFPFLFVFVLLVWHSPELVGVEVPSLLNYLPASRLVYGATFVLSGVGIAIFGVISLRADTFVPAIGGFLLVLAASWLFLIGTASVYGFPIPNWVANVQGVIMGAALFGIGYLLRTKTATIDRAELSTDTTAR